MYIFLTEIPGIKTPNTRSSRKSVSTSSVSQHSEAPPVSRSRSHSSATTLEVIKESDISVVKKRPGQYLEESETAASPIKKTPGRPRKNPIPVVETSEVDKKSDISVVKKRPGQYLEESETATSPIKKTPGRPKKNAKILKKKMKRAHKEHKKVLKISIYRSFNL